MNTEIDSDHRPLSAEELYDYFQMQLDDEQEQEIEEHLADCSACAETARQVRDIDYMLEGWTAQNHARALLQAKAVRWQEHLGTLVEGAVRVVMQAPEKRAHFVTEHLASLLSPTALWQFEPVRVGVRGGKEVPPVTRVKAEGEVPVQITFSGDREITVFVSKVRPGQSLPRVILYHEEEGELREVASEVLVHEQGRSSLHVRFALPSAEGEYLVTLHT